jgi:hypothetical protein
MPPRASGVGCEVELSGAPGEAGASLSSSDVSGGLVVIRRSDVYAVEARVDERSRKLITEAIGFEFKV